MNIKFMFFYADWCPHSIKAKVEWKIFKDTVNEMNIDGNWLQCLEYDCTDPDDEMEDLMEKYEVTAYPSIQMVGPLATKTELKELLAPILEVRDTFR